QPELLEGWDGGVPQGSDDREQQGEHEPRKQHRRPLEEPVLPLDRGLPPRGRLRHTACLCVLEWYRARHIDGSGRGRHHNPPKISEAILYAARVDASGPVPETRVTRR